MEIGNTVSEQYKWSEYSEVFIKTSSGLNNSYKKKKEEEEYIYLKVDIANIYIYI